MKKNQMINFEDVQKLARAYAENFTIFGKEVDSLVFNRMLILATAKLQGWGGKVKLTSGKLVLLSTICGFVTYCAKLSENTFEGPLDHMDRLVDKFCAKNAEISEDRVILKGLCYDVNTLDI